MNIFRVLFFLLFLGGTIHVNAQQDAHYSQYMFNGLLINPAMAGSKSAISGALFAKRQWVNFEGAPSFQSLSLHAPLNHNRVGLGLIVLCESIFAENFLTFGTCYSYKINLRQGLLAFGLQAGFKQYHFNPDEFEIKDAEDKVLSDKQSSINPDLGSGLYYQKKKYYVGISIQHMIPSSKKSLYKLSSHYYFTAARKFNLNPKLELIPSTLLKTVKGTDPQLDLTCHLKHTSVGWVGASWRTSEAASVQAGISLESIFPKLHQSMKIGYAYDFTLTGLNSLLGDSHEVMLIWDIRIPEKLSKIEKRAPSVSPLFF